MSWGVFEIDNYLCAQTIMIHVTGSLKPLVSDLLVLRCYFLNLLSNYTQKRRVKKGMVPPLNCQAAIQVSSICTYGQTS